MRIATVHGELRKLFTEFSLHAVHAPSLRHELLMPLHAMTARGWKAFKAFYLPRAAIPADEWKEWVPFPDATRCSLYRGDPSGYHPFLGLAVRGIELLGEAGAAAGGLTGGVPRDGAVHDWLRWVYETANSHGRLHLLTVRFGQELWRTVKAREAILRHTVEGRPCSMVVETPTFGIFHFSAEAIRCWLTFREREGFAGAGSLKPERMAGRLGRGREIGQAAFRPVGPGEESGLPREVSTAEASEILGISKDTLLAYKRKGLLPCRNLAPPGSTKPVYMFPLDAVVRLRTTYQTDELAPAEPRDPPRRVAKGRPQFKHLIIDDEA